MDITQEHRKEVERKIVEIIIDALGKNLISVNDKNTISAFILERMPIVRTHEELIDFPLRVENKHLGMEEIKQWLKEHGKT